MRSLRPRRARDRRKTVEEALGPGIADDGAEAVGAALGSGSLKQLRVMMQGVAQAPPLRVQSISAALPSSLIGSSPVV